MSDIYPVPQSFRERAHLDKEGYEKAYKASVEDSEKFWEETARRLDWIEFPTKIKDISFDKADLHIRWYEDGVLNACYNCVDRHLGERGDQTAIIWEGDDPSRDEHISYRQLYERVCRMANVLKARGVEKGDRVTIYMPMIPEAAIAMLACARIGAVHSIVFGGFSPDALAGRIIDCDSNTVITADQGLRGGRIVPLKDNVDAACDIEGVMDCLRSVIVIRNTGGDIGWTEGRDFWYHEEEANVSDDCPVEPMNAEDPLFILYTSGSTGIRPAATWFTPLTPMKSFSITTTGTSTGAPPTWVGSRATATSFTARSRTARSR